MSRKKRRPAARALLAAGALGLAAGCRESAPPEGNGTSPPAAVVPGVPGAGGAAAAAAAEPEAVVPGTEVEVPAYDPAFDGWESEVFADAVAAQLKVVKQALTARPEAADWAAVRALVAGGYAGPALRPPGATDLLVDGGLTVRRASRGAGSGAGSDAPAFSGPAGWEASLRAWAGLWAGGAGEAGGDVRAAAKVVRVAEGGDGRPTARVILQVGGASAGGRLQANVVWDCTFERAPAAHPTGADTGAGRPRLAALAVVDYEEVELGGGGEGAPTPAPAAPFADCTEAVVGGAVFDAQLRRGIGHWLDRLETRLGIDVGGWQGLAVADVDGDGRDDVYFCQPGGLPNRLFVQRPDGSAEERSAAAGVDLLDSTHSALFADFDNDGDQDLAAAVTEGVAFFANDGAGVFQPVATKLFPAAHPYSMAAADYDRDGDLDLFVCGYNRRAGVNRHIDFARPVPYHEAENGGRNVLLRNEGRWRLRHVTVEVGLDENNRRFSYAAAWEDYDDDGDLDLYVANDFGRNNLYRQDALPGGGVRFVDVAEEAGVLDVGPGMSACWGDYDNDGRMDLYVGNMFSSAGSRISRQARFLPEGDAGTRGLFQRHARGNSLFRNLGPEGPGGATVFAEVGEEAGVTVGRWAWGSKFADLNNDGREDIVVANGFITQEDPGDL